MFNLTVLTGRLTADPELKTSSGGFPVMSFSIAVERRQKNADGERETDFLNIVAWRNTAEFVNKWFKKGDMIGIEGTIQTRKYTDKNGNNRTAFEIVANNVDFVGSKKQDGAPNIDPASDPLPALQDNINNAFAESEIDDDLPF